MGGLPYRDETLIVGKRIPIWRGSWLSAPSLEPGRATSVVDIRIATSLSVIGHAHRAGAVRRPKNAARYGQGEYSLRWEDRPRPLAGAELQPGEDECMPDTGGGRTHGRARCCPREAYGLMNGVRRPSFSRYKYRPPPPPPPQLPPGPFTTPSPGQHNSSYSVLVYNSSPGPAAARVQLISAYYFLLRLSSYPHPLIRPQQSLNLSRSLAFPAMSTSSPTQLSPARSPSLASVFPRSPRDTPATPPTSSTACSPHAPPTPPDSSSRIPSALNPTPSPRSADNFNTSSEFSLSTTLSASGPQFQSRLIDTPIDIHCLPPELDSPTTTQDDLADMDRHDAFNFKVREQGSPSTSPNSFARTNTPLSCIDLEPLAQRQLRKQWRANYLQMHFHRHSFLLPLVSSLRRKRLGTARSSLQIPPRTRPTCTSMVCLPTSPRRIY